MQSKKHGIAVAAAVVAFGVMSIVVGIDQARGTSAHAPTFISPPAPQAKSQPRGFEALTTEQKRALLSNVGPRRSLSEKAVSPSRAETDPAKARALVSNVPSGATKEAGLASAADTRPIRIVHGVELGDGEKANLGATRMAPLATSPKVVKSADETAQYRPQSGTASTYVVPAPHPPRQPVAPASPKSPNRQKSIAAGEDISTAISLSLPVTVVGSTVGYIDDYDESCPWVSPGAPDIVYSYSPSRIEGVAIDLCASSYDTKVYVYQDLATPGSPYACDDDYCGLNGWRSFIDCVTMFPGHTYYIVVDGFAGSTDGQEGDFVLDLRLCLIGDRIDNAIPIPSLPFADSRDTGPYYNDYDESCPYFADGSPDIVFSYKPTEDQRIQIDLCNSQYDSKVYIYAGSATPGSPYQCNDDYCGVDNWRSFIPCFHVTAGETYFIVVDGFGGAAGVYDLDIRECCDGLAGCSAVSPAEGETCGDNPDVTNGGCNSSPFICTPFAPEESVCGTVWWDGNTRDTDWYLASLSEGDSVTWCVTANFQYVAAIILWDESLCGNPTVISFAEADACTELCLPLKSYSNAQYAFFVAPSFNSPGLNCAEGPWEYNAELRKICPANIPSGGVVFEEEECLTDPSLDVVNGGCNYVPEAYSPIVPGVPVWGYGSWVGSSRDTDWYRLAYPLVEGDSVTWCVTANFAFTALIVDLRNGCGALTVPVEVDGGPCDTMYAGLRIAIGGDYAFFVAPQFTHVTYLCADGPWVYQGTLSREAACQWTGCLPGAAAEGESCVEALDDFYNGGCNVNPSAFQAINSGDHICGEAWSRPDLGMRDTDWYEKVVYPGETATWCVRAQFPVNVFIVDITDGCGAYTIIDAAYGAPCEWTTVSYTALVKSDLVFFVAPDFAADIPCASGPWQYDAFLDPGPTCELPECAIADVNENEPCVADQDLFNAGCGSIPPRYTEISVGQTFCGTSQFSPFWTDFDWYHCSLTTGQVIRYTTEASYPMEAGVFDLTAGCSSFSLIAYGNVGPCAPLELNFTAPNTGDYAFAIGPYNSACPPLICEHGPWPYSGSISGCACQCAHDPRCDGVTDILDVTLTINVAFRDGAPIPDSSAICPRQTTDVDCSGATDIIDVTKMINVAFRDGSPLTNFCDPCAAVPIAETTRTSPSR